MVWIWRMFGGEPPVGVTYEYVVSLMSIVRGRAFEDIGMELLSVSCVSSLLMETLSKS